MSKKSNNKNKSILELFSGQEAILNIPKIYVTLTGSLVTALVLNQCIYYSGISKRPDGEFYKNYDEWFEESCLSKKQIICAIKKLTSLGFVITKIKKARGAPTVHYTSNIDKITQAIHDLLLINSDNNQREHKDKNNTENTCINIALVLPKGTMDSDQRELSIVTKGNYPYTDELAVDLAIERESATHSQKISTSENQPPVTDESCIKLFNEKFGNKQITIEEIYEEYSSHARLSKKGITIFGFKKWIAREEDKFPLKNSRKDNEFYRAPPEIKPSEENTKIALDAKKKILMMLAEAKKK